jgi:hypothetical protein
LVVAVFSRVDLVVGGAVSICVEAEAWDSIWGWERFDDGPSSMASKIAERRAESLGSVSRETAFGCGKLAMISDSLRSDYGEWGALLIRCAEEMMLGGVSRDFEILTSG